jgi:hypothetical protein
MYIVNNIVFIFLLVIPLSPLLSGHALYRSVGPRREALIKAAIDEKSAIKLKD